MLDNIDCPPPLLIARQIQLRVSLSSFLSHALTMSSIWLHTRFVGLLWQLTGTTSRKIIKNKERYSLNSNNTKCGAGDIRKIAVRSICATPEASKAV